jgi:hypothetical protein
MGILYDQQLLSFIMPCIREAQRYIFISTFKAQWTNNREGQRLALALASWVLADIQSMVAEFTT